MNRYIVVKQKEIEAGTPEEAIEKWEQGGASVHVTANLVRVPQQPSEAQKKTGH